MYNRAHGRFLVAADGRWFALGLFSFCLGFFLRVLRFFLARCINNSTSAFGLRLLLWLFGLRLIFRLWVCDCCYGFWLAAAVPAFGMRLLFWPWSVVAVSTLGLRLLLQLFCDRYFDL